jgi:tetratricopeptide (TPR) repeat protein
VLLATGSLDVVLTDTLSTLRANPEHQPALLLAGIAYHQKSRHHEATALLERSLAQHPSCWPAAHFLALSLDALGQKGAALAAFRCVKESQQPTPAAQALIDLLDFGPWRSEAVALACLRLGELQSPTSTSNCR